MTGTAPNSSFLCSHSAPSSKEIKIQIQFAHAKVWVLNYYDIHVFRYHGLITTYIVSNYAQSFLVFEVC